MVVFYTQMSPRTFCSAPLCSPCAAAQCLSDSPHSLESLWKLRFLPLESLSSYLLSDFTPLQSVQSQLQDDIPLNFPEKQCRKASSLWAVECFLICVYSRGQKNIAQLACDSSIVEGLYQTTRPCSDSSGFIYWRNTSKHEKHQREQQTCEEWLVSC